ncbi:MAG: hypothetical protein WDZ48_02995, partial [Pirellulales bacterium]
VSRYLPQVRFIMPRELGGASLAVDATASPSGHAVTLSETDASGIYQAQLTGSDGAHLVERFAVNVVPDEGDLKKLGATQLAGRLDGVPYEFHQAGDINYNPQQLAGLNLSTSLLYLLIVMLFAEQVLAYSCSYHPRGKEGRAG